MEIAILREFTMPTNHGIYRKLQATSGQRLASDEAMVFRYGILQIFQAMKTGPFLTNPDERRRAAQLEHHFRTLCQRFVFSLQQLNGLMQELIHCYSQQDVSHDSMKVGFQAECLADHVLIYLNTIVDDVAIGTAIATGFAKPDPIDNMGKLRNLKDRTNPVLAPVKHLLDELDLAGSWWELAFKKEQGARQLLVHNQHLVAFQISSVAHGPFEASAVLMSPFAQTTFACCDFFGLLRDILSGLFGWLDHLEAALASHLKSRAPGWLPVTMCPFFFLPVGYPGGVTRYDWKYFPIPLCDGSDSLPWSVSVASAANSH